MVRSTNACIDAAAARGHTAFDWKRAHEALVSLAKRRGAHELEEGRWLLAGLRAEVHRHLGHGSYAEYLERLFGYGPREVAERLRVARALEELPATAEALATGAACYSAIRELTRVATPDTEKAWLEASQGMTMREIEKLVRGRGAGDVPSDPVDDRARRHLLRFEVSAEAYALWREAVAELRRQVGSTMAAPAGAAASGALDEDEVLLMMARQVLGGPTDEGRASYQVAMTVCERCGRGWQDGRGEPVAVEPAIVEMACCDAQHIGALAPQGIERSGALAPQGIERGGVDTVGHVSCGECLDTHVGRSVELAPHRTRASQSIPPATRRGVMRRDHGRCVVAGCRAATFVDVHHLDPRAEGGGHERDGLVTLCGAHHRAVHKGALLIEGDAAAGLSFFHADGSRYGIARADAGAIEARQRAFAALRHLGFKETASRHALEAVSAHVGVGARLDELVRGAIAMLT